MDAPSPGPTLDDVKRDPEVEAFIQRANASLGVIGYTEHGGRHARVRGQRERHRYAEPAHR
ncbi:MAG: hypothetical protein K6W08_07265 [Firmicutes bacterium]|nr:hypothetical protein [Bacillota bacterium]